MPFALTFIGLLLIITGFQNTYKQFGAMVQGDFTGENNFLYWMAAIAVIGGLGYIKGLEGFSRAFMFLILIALVAATYKKNPQIFANIKSGIDTGTTTKVDPIGASLTGGGGSGGSSSTGSGFNLSNIQQDVSIAATVASLF